VLPAVVRGDKVRGLTSARGFNKMQAAARIYFCRVYF
jgi:hypothetical protein